MNRKSKGIKAERELVTLFCKTGKWLAIRVAGSGSSRFASPDVLAGNRIRKLAIECKSVKGNKKYLSDEDVDQIKEFSDIFGAEPWIGVKFNSDWYFLSLDDLKKTEKGYSVSRELAKNKGLLFDELIRE